MKKLSKHILHIAKRRTIPSAEMQEILSANPDVLRCIGALPPDIITKYDLSQRGQITENIDKIFYDFSMQVADFSFGSKTTKVDIQNPISDSGPYCAKLQQRLQNALKCDDIYVDFIDSGTQKHCFRIKMHSQAYALLVFKNTNLYMPNNKEKHGPLIEPQNSFAIYNRMPHGRFAKPFMARVSDTERYSGAYILSKFIDGYYKTKPHHSKFITAHNYMRSNDIDNNMMNTVRGVIVDFGDFTYNSLYMSDKKARAAWRCIAQILNEFDFTTFTAFNVHTKLRKYYLKDQDDFFDTTKWPALLKTFSKQERPVARKVLKLLRKLKITCDKIKNENEYGAIKDILHDDFVRFFNFRMFNKDFSKQFFSGSWPSFYPEIVADIIGTNNVPLLADLISEITKHNPKINIETNDKKQRIHWNKYYSKSEILKMAQNRPELDWSIVLSDFEPANNWWNISRFLRKAR